MLFSSACVVLAFSSVFIGPLCLASDELPPALTAGGLASALVLGVGVVSVLVAGGGLALVAAGSFGSFASGSEPSCAAGNVPSFAASNVPSFVAGGVPSGCAAADGWVSAFESGFLLPAAGA